MMNSEEQSIFINILRTISAEEEILYKPNVIINDEKNYRETISCKQLPPNRIVLYYAENP